MPIKLRLEATPARNFAVEERLTIRHSRDRRTATTVNQLSARDHVDGLGAALAAAVVVDGYGGTALCGRESEQAGEGGEDGVEVHVYLENLRGDVGSECLMEFLILICWRRRISASVGQ